MDGSRFDAWTRRRFGVAAGGLAAALLGLAGLGAAEAHKKHDHHKEKRCKKLGTGCNPKPHWKKKCCKGECQFVSGIGGNRCCHDFQGAPCTHDHQCCGTFLCVGPEGSKTCQPPLL